MATQDEYQRNMEKAWERITQLCGSYSSAYIVGDMKTCANIQMEAQEMLDAVFANVKGIAEIARKQATGE